MAHSAHNELTTNDYLLTTKRAAFTMAEILLSLTIIGIVAAITLPTLVGNINERAWNAQRKAFYSRMSQAISLMPSINGYGILNDDTDTAAETFVTDGLAKVLKINNICNNEHLKDCGMPASVTNMLGSKNPIPTTIHELNGFFSDSEAYVKDTKAAAFETNNGEAVTVYYNPKCKESDAIGGWKRSQIIMCVNFIYDLNGSKGPNTFGKDIGIMTVFNPAIPSIVAPLPLPKDATKNAGAYGKSCVKHGSDGRIPTPNELSAMSYNSYIIGLPEGLYCANEKNWGEYFAGGTRGYHGCINLRCIKR